MTHLPKLLTIVITAITLLTSCNRTDMPTSESVGASISNPFAKMKWGNGYWTVAENSVPGAYAVVPDPETGTGAVQRFTLREGDCGTGRYWDDCKYRSGRYEFMEDVWDHPSYRPRAQPKESWYSWEVRLGEGTKYGINQPMGPIILGQFKQGQTNCPLIILRHQAGHRDSNLMVTLQRDTGLEPPKDCINPAGGDQQVGDINELIGRWARVEMFIRWSSRDDGRVDVYIDGEQRMEYEGPNCFRTCNDIYRKYGLYFANQRGGTPLSEINAYYRNVGRSSKRENLPR